MKELKINARFDEEANVWYVEGSNIPGLRAEAETQEELLAELKGLIPALLVANDGNSIGRPVARKRPPTRGEP